MPLLFASRREFAVPTLAWGLLAGCTSPAIPVYRGFVILGISRTMTGGRQ
jgi:hypothetical protein